MKRSMLFFVLAIALGILFASLILWSRSGKEKYGELPPLSLSNSIEETIPSFSEPCPFKAPSSNILHDYLH